MIKNKKLKQKIQKYKENFEAMLNQKEFEISNHI